MAEETVIPEDSPLNQPTLPEQTRKFREEVERAKNQQRQGQEKEDGREVTEISGEDSPEQIAEERGVSEPETEKQEEILRQVERVKEAERGGFTQSEKQQIAQGQERIRQAEAITEAQQQEEEIDQEVQQAEEEIRRTEQRIREADQEPGQQTFTVAGESGLTREEALEKLDQLRSQLRERAGSARQQIQDFISERREDISILRQTQEASEQTDPLEGQTTESAIQDLSFTERIASAVATGSTAGFSILGTQAAERLGFEEEGATRERVEQEFEEFRLGKSATEAGVELFTQSPAFVGATSVVGGAAIGRGIQLAGSGALGTVARVGAAAGGTVLVGGEAFGAAQQFAAGEEGEAIGRGLRLGLTVAGAAAGARAVQPQVTGQSRTVTSRSTLQRQGSGTLRGAGRGRVITRQTVRQPRILRAPKETTRTFITNVKMSPIKSRGGQAAGRITVESFRVGQSKSVPLQPRFQNLLTDPAIQAGTTVKGTAAFNAAKFNIVKPLRGPNFKVGFFESAGKQVSTNLPFTQRLPTQLVGTRISNPFTGTRTDVASLQLPISKVTRPEGTQTQAVSFGTAGSRGFQGAGRTTVLRSGSTPSVSRSGGGTQQTTQDTGLDLQALARTAADIYGGVPSTAGSTGTAEATTAGAGAVSRIAGSAGQETVDVSAFTGSQQQDSSVTTTFSPGRTVTVQREDEGQDDTVTVDTGRITPQRRQRTQTGTRPQQRNRQRNRLEERPAAQIRDIQDVGVGMEEIAQLRTSPRTRTGTRTGFGQPTQFTQRPGTATPLGGLDLPDLGVDLPATRINIDRGQPAQHGGRAPALDIDILSANLAKTETGEATFPGEQEVKQFRGRQRRGGMLARLRAQEVESGEAERLKPFGFDRDRRLY